MARKKNSSPKEKSTAEPVEAPLFTAPAPALAPAPPAPAAEIAEREQTPWANFNEPPANPTMDTEAIRKAIKEKEAADAALVGAPGFHWHEAMRDSGSGKYRKGKRYMLPNGQSPARFKRLG